MTLENIVQWFTRNPRRVREGHRVAELLASFDETSAVVLTDGEVYMLGASYARQRRAADGKQGAT